jgi:hypothetical protein
MPVTRVGVVCEGVRYGESHTLKGGGVMAWKREVSAIRQSSPNRYNSYCVMPGSGIACRVIVYDDDAGRLQY